MYADSQKTKPVAIIVPAEPALKNLAKKNGIPGDSIEELASNKKLQGLVLKELQQAGRQGGLNGIEIIEGVVVADEEWIPQNVGSFSCSCLDVRRLIICRTWSHQPKSSTGSSSSANTRRISTLPMGVSDRCLHLWRW